MGADDPLPNVDGEPSGRLLCIMITCFFAPPGAGKTCVLSLIAHREVKRLKKGRSKYKAVYTNYPCKGTSRIHIHDLANFYVHDALIILDEVTMELDSRDWKQTPKGLVQFIVTHRHLNCDIVYAVQDWSRAEKSLRSNTVQLYYIRRSPLPFFNRWAHLRQIFRKLDVNEHSSELVLGYRFSDWVDSLTSVFQKGLYPTRYYIPRAFGLFDSWDSYGLDRRPEKKLIPWVKENNATPATGSQESKK